MGAFGGPNIVEDGLVFSADAGNKQCYISGSASPDIIIDSIKGAQGTVDNTITYNPANGGYWVFDGSDSDIALVWYLTDSDGLLHLLSPFPQRTRTEGNKKNQTN